jgi:hypothetical protein
MLDRYSGEPRAYAGGATAHSAISCSWFPATILRFGHLEQECRDNASWVGQPLSPPREVDRSGELRSSDGNELRLTMTTFGTQRPGGG